MIGSPYFTIPAGQPFARDLARGILALCPDSGALSKTCLLLPSHLTIKTVRDAFLHVLDGKPALLPQMRIIGELDSDEPFLMSLRPPAAADIPIAITKLERQFLLARQIAKLPIGGALPSSAQALALAKSLSVLIDDLHSAGTPLSALAEVLPDDLAQHWQDIYRFLQIVMTHWPSILATRGQIDPADRQMRLAKAQAQMWQESPPEDLVVLAGSTGSLQETREMMKLVSQLPKGMIVFPGFAPNIFAEADDIAPIIAAPTHPFAILAQTLEAIDCAPDQIQLWPGCSIADVEQSEARRAFFYEVFRPAEQTARWRQLRELDTRIDHKSVAGLHRMTAASDHAEAQLIASLMREVLEDDTKTAMLITEDRGLAGLVAAELLRWDIVVDHSSGETLSNTSVGQFLQLLAELPAAISPAQALLNLLKHPLVCSGFERGQFLRQLRAIEIHALRGVLEDRSLKGIAARLAGHPELQQFFSAHIATPLAPLLKACAATAGNLPDLAKILSAVAEALAASKKHPDGAMRLYEGVAGIEAAKLLSDLADCDTDYRINTPELAPVLHSLAGQISVRSAHTKHPRLSILGTRQSRMQCADRVILGGLNEGSWPPKQTQDFWMNAAARSDLNLPSRYWRAGLAAHDFLMAASQSEVYLTRSKRQGDTPTRPSRFLSRLQAVLEATQLQPYVPDDIPAPLLACLRADRVGTPSPVQPPEPRPPVLTRPRHFSATEFDVWITDPYAIYAKRILKLRKLEPVDDAPGPALRGTLIHGLLAELAKGDSNKADALKKIAQFWSNQPIIERFWTVQMATILDWVGDIDTARRSDIDKFLVEQRGEISLSLASGPISISARADRLEQLQDGGLRLVDFKTGATPSKMQLKNMRKTQMLIEALIATQGGFESIAAGAPISAIEYWKLSGKPDNPGEIRNVCPDKFDVAEIEARLMALLAHYDLQSTAYVSEPNFRAKPDFSDVRHLARVREWRATEVEDD